MEVSGKKFFSSQYIINLWNFWKQEKLMLTNLDGFENRLDEEMENKSIKS